MTDFFQQFFKIGSEAADRADICNVLNHCGTTELKSLVLDVSLCGVGTSGRHSLAVRSEQKGLYTWMRVFRQPSLLNIKVLYN